MIRIGFIGTGNISRRHFTALAKLRDQVEVVAVCDLFEDRARAAAEPLGEHVYTSAHELFRPERLDAAYICVPPDAHVDQELTCAAEGIHTQRVVLAANRSAETGQPVRLGRS